MQGKFVLGQKKIPRYQIRAPTDEDEILGRPGSAEDREEATIGKRALMYFPPPLNGHCAGIIESYGGSKYGGNYYHVAFDDGDEGDYTWREIQLGMRWQAAAGFTPTPHDEELPAGPISSAGGPE